jgi:GMP synthase-like glutamine amidotransferase
VIGQRVYPSNGNVPIGATGKIHEIAGTEYLVKFDPKIPSGEEYAGFFAGSLELCQNKRFKVGDAVRVKAGSPFLGVCHGHQSLARALGGKPAVRRAAAPEVGWTHFEVLDDSPLFAGLGRQFVSFSSHNDEVRAFPAGLRNLARSEGCAVQAVQLGNRPVFGIQFHPEKDLELTRACFDEQLSKGKRKDQLLHPDESEALYDPRVGETIFRNFLNLQAVY